MSAEAAPLSESAFIAGITPRERSFWRYVATVVTGGGGGLVVALIAGAIVFLAYAEATGMFAGGPEAIRHRVAALLLAPSPDATTSLTLMALAVATNGPWAIVIVAIAALVAGRRIGTYLTAAPSFRWRLLAGGLALSFLVIGPVVAIGQLMDPHAPPPPLLGLVKDLSGRLAYAGACVLLLIPAAAAEEVVFRGWLLRQSAAVLPAGASPLTLMIFNGVAFAAIHGDFMPLFGACLGVLGGLAAANAVKLGGPDTSQAVLGAAGAAAGGYVVFFFTGWHGNFADFFTRVLMGAGFVYMTLRLGGIEFSTGAHAANNILIVLFIQPLTLRPTPSSGVSIDSLLQDAFLFFSYVAMTELIARWTPLRRWTGADRATPPASAAAERSA